MESSEDDAGNATSASRRVSAREKDVGQAEDVDATSCYHQEQYEARTMCGTPAMSEDNFDGDSIPSPSAQDVSTSTEAILDMIDEIVDGPGAPKRIPPSLQNCETLAEASIIVIDRLDPKQDSTKPDNIHIPLPSEVSVVRDTESENICDATQMEVQVQCSSANTISAESRVGESTVSCIPSAIEPEIDKPGCFQLEINCPVSSLESEPSTSCSVSSIPSSNITQDVQNSSEISDIEKLERTVKCVSSSDNRDNVTVESAESTSSDCNLSEIKTISAEPTTTRSPLKRRLLRPVPSDRRPDSTVSSTGDSQCMDVETTKPINSESIVKDVSSSSDAVPTLQGSDKCEEIRNVSEISICKAETSVSPPKKIKLIRQKINPTVCKNDVIVDKQIPNISNECDSIISDSPAVKLIENLPETSTCITLQKSVVDLKLVSPEPVVDEQTTVSITKKEECIETVCVVIPKPILEHSLSKHDKETCKEVEQAVPDLPVSILSAIEKDLISCNQTSETHNASTNLEEPKEKIIGGSQSVTDKTISSISKETNLVSNIDYSTTNEQSSVSPECSVTSEPDSNTDSGLVPDNNPNCTVSQSDQDVMEKKSPQSSDTSQESGKEKCEDQSSNISDLKNIEELSSIESIVKPLNELNSNISDSNQEVEKKVPLINLNLTQVSNISEECITEKHEDQSSNDTDEKNQQDICNIDSNVKPLAVLNSNVADNNQETEKKVPPIKLNISQLSDTSQKCINEKHEEQSLNISNVKNVQDVSDTDSKIKSVSELSSKHSDSNQETEKKVPPIKLNLSQHSDTVIENKSMSPDITSNTNKSNLNQDEPESIKQVPKLTIKLNNKSPEDIKSPVPKLTIKPIRPPVDNDSNVKIDNTLQIQNITKINIKAIPKPTEKTDTSMKHVETEESKTQCEHIPTITKLNIKPILKPPEKINDMHRKSSSSEISESECSENDESTTTSDQASTSDNGAPDVVPKVTIKLGKPGTQSEGKFYTEQNIPKLTIKSVSHSEKEESESVSKLKVVISQPEDNQVEKVPKLTIKTVAKSESQPLSPKLTIKPIRPLDNFGKEPEIPKLKITTESNVEIKENLHVPKITIKPITKPDTSDTSKATKKPVSNDNPEHIPVVTKLNIKPVLKPIETGESSEVLEDKVPVISKLNIKPVLKPKENEVDSSIEDIPKITKLNIKPLKNPEVNASEQKDCDEMNADIEKNSIPVVTKLNIKPIVKPLEKGKSRDSENQSSETGNSSDENVDHIPVVTKLNIKPILKPAVLEEASRMANEPSIPVLTKLNIKPLIKRDDSPSPSSPKRDLTKIPGSHSPTIPVITKLNIKPLIKPDETELIKPKEDHEEKLAKNPPLVMKINMKAVTDSVINEMCATSQYSCNSIKDGLNIKAKSDISSGNHNEVGTQKISSERPESLSAVETTKSGKLAQEHDTSSKQNCVDLIDDSKSVGTTSESKTSPLASPKVEESRPNAASDVDHSSSTSVLNKVGQQDITKVEVQGSGSKGTEILRKSSRATLQYCTLLKKLLENPKEELTRKSNELKDSVKVDGKMENLRSSPSLLKDNVKSEPNLSRDNKNKVDNMGHSEKHNEHMKNKSSNPDKTNITSVPSESNKVLSLQDFSKIANESVTKPLEINVTEKITNQSSGQDSPRIILKINKTDHGPSAKIITEDVKKSEVIQSDNIQLLNDKPSPKKQVENCRKKGNADLSTQNVSVRTRLRSSRKIDSIETPPTPKQTVGKRPSSTEPSPPQNRENEMSGLDAKRLKLGQILSNNAMQISPNVSITPIVGKVTQSLSTKPNLEIRQGGKLINHSMLNNENCSKNGNSKLHNILSNLHAKQMRELPLTDINCLEKTQSTSSEMDSNASTGSSEMAVNVSSETRPIELQEMLINENSDFRDLSTGPEELSQDPLESGSVKPPEDPSNGTEMPQPVDTTPQPKKRGRPRKLPVAESPKPVALPVPALEERPQRSLRLTRERPIIVAKTRGRGRGRGARRGSALQMQSPQPERVPTPPAASPSPPPASATPIDPTSSRIKLPRMTEALDKMPSSSSTPVSSGTSDLNLFSDRVELKVVLEPAEIDESFMKSPESMGRPKSGRGSRGGRWRTPRGRGRGRGGGRGAMYMKETMGIYGRVCGPATTTVQLFEEETCMMDDNATPAKPSHLMDEDSQSSVKSSTNESSKMKKSKFADLFDSNKVWTAADVKEYTWPPTPRSDIESQVMMIQEQVAMFLGVKSFKRRYPELKRRSIVGEERDYVLGKGLVTEALCDLGITAVDASEVLDIMLSDYPHKYEEYRSHQRERQMTEAVEEPSADTKSDEKQTKIEIKQDKSVEHKPEPPKVDPEKTRQDMAAAAIASASEWNARANALRRPACVDLQSLTVHVRRAPIQRAQTHVRPPAGFYPHALLPGQYQHWYRQYTPEQLRYFPLNTACSAPPPPPPTWECSSSSEGEVEGDGSRAGDEDDSDAPTHPTHHNKRKKLTKTKRSSQTEVSKEKEESRSSMTEGEVDTCKVCKLRLEANRKYTHERFLVCANCNAKLHPSCVELNADTIRKCREYAWQCAECKSCGACQRPADDDKMLFCDLCDRGFHIYCVGLDAVPQGRWHCVECAICKSCGARDPSGLGGGGPSGQGAPSGSEASPAPAEWHHQTKRGPGGHKCYSHSLCTPCARVR